MRGAVLSTLVICLSSARSLAWFEVEIVIVSHERDSVIGSVKPSLPIKPDTCGRWIWWAPHHTGSLEPGTIEMTFIRSGHLMLEYANLCSLNSQPREMLISRIRSKRRPPNTQSSWEAGENQQGGDHESHLPPISFKKVNCMWKRRVSFPLLIFQLHDNKKSHDNLLRTLEQTRSGSTPERNLRSKFRWFTNLQFTWLIAVCCVLLRTSNQGIHCYKLSKVLYLFIF
jgi:hypothetical protein